MKILLSLIAIVVGALLFGMASPVSALSAPTIVQPKNNYLLPPDAQLVVTGLVKNDSSVFFVIDGKFAGGVKATSGKKGTASFAFKPKLKFGIGNHTIQVQARSGTETSAWTDKLTFVVPKTWPRRIDGVIVPYAQANVQPIGIMVENLASVRPQAGLASASIVYEALAEGGVPRFLMLTVLDNQPRIGPVRSARPYYVDLAKEYGATLLHAGGSRDAFNEFGKMKVRSIDALVNKTARYFFRAGRTATTHNLFTSGALIKKMKNDFKLTTSVATFESWKFKDDAILKNRPNERKKLTIDFKSGSQYIVSWAYDRTSNSFLRYNGGKPHGDANLPAKAVLSAKNVIVQLIEKEKVLDWQKHLALQITGGGKGWLLQDGKLSQIIWRKPLISSRTRYYYTNGQEVQFVRGTTWVEIVPKDRPVLWK